MPTPIMRTKMRKRILKKELGYFLGTFNSMARVCFTTAIGVTVITIALEFGLKL
ncbi:hypothetical protein [Shewanella maritima]|uniref:hypothetical protein n=1 Tax=Shewanella maritima TaxID=2520507 RepID=UPI003735C3BA